MTRHPPRATPGGGRPPGAREQIQLSLGVDFPDLMQLCSGAIGVSGGIDCNVWTGQAGLEDGDIMGTAAGYRLDCL